MNIHDIIAKITGRRHLYICFSHTDDVIIINTTPAMRSDFGLCLNPIAQKKGYAFSFEGQKTQHPWFTVDDAAIEALQAFKKCDCGKPECNAGQERREFIDAIAQHKGKTAVYSEAIPHSFDTDLMRRAMVLMADEINDTGCSFEEAARIGHEKFPEQIMSVEEMNKYNKELNLAQAKQRQSQYN